MSINIFVYGFWTIALGLAVGVISFAAITAYKSTPIATRNWRIVKVISSILGLVGLVLLLLNFEQLVRDIIIGKSRSYAQIEFYEAKFLITHRKSLACAKDMSTDRAKSTCADFENIDQLISADKLRSGSAFGLIRNWQKNPELDQTILELNEHLTDIDRSLRVTSWESAFSDIARIRIAMISVILVILGIAGSIGESIFQYRQTK